MICEPCKVQHHEECPDVQAGTARSRCFCQHKVAKRDDDAKSGESFEG